MFPQLGGEKSILEGRHEITWNAFTLSHLDQHTNQCELEVQMIIHLQNLANQLPDAFVDTKKVTKSHTPLQMFQHGLISLKDKKHLSLKHARSLGDPLSQKT